MQVLYALTAGVAGYVSAVQYKTMGGTNWVSTVCLSLSQVLNLTWPTASSDHASSFCVKVPVSSS